MQTSFRLANIKWIYPHKTLILSFLSGEYAINYKNSGWGHVKNTSRQFYGKLNLNFSVVHFDGCFITDIYKGIIVNYDFSSELIFLPDLYAESVEGKVVCLLAYVTIQQVIVLIGSCYHLPA